MRSIITGAVGAACLVCSTSGKSALIYQSWGLASNATAAIVVSPGNGVSDTHSDTDSGVGTDPIASHSLFSKAEIGSSVVTLDYTASVSAYDHGFELKFANNFDMSESPYEVHTYGSTGFSVWFDLTAPSSYKLTYDFDRYLYGDESAGQMAFWNLDTGETYAGYGTDSSFYYVWQGILQPGSYIVSGSFNYHDRNWAEWYNPQGGARAAQESGLVKIEVLELAAVPEPASWTLMIGGFAVVGTSMRRRAKIALA